MTALLDPQRTAALAALGTQFSPALFGETRALFEATALRPDSRACEVRRDLCYGPDERHRLDLFRPRGRTAAGPTLLFVHGGGFIGGDKGAADEPFYNNIGAWAAQEGFVGATMTYRLAPGAGWPAGSQDVAAAVRWLRENGASTGGDPERIVVMGQSAGAAHVAGYLADPRLGAGADIVGAVMLSGLYDLETLAHSPLEKAYYGDDPTQFRERSSLAGLIGSSVPCLFAVAEHDPDSFQQQAAEFVRRHVKARGRWPRMLYLTGHNHLSPVLVIGEAADPLSAELGAFVRNIAGRKG